jgi:hypothetical protein
MGNYRNLDFFQINHLSTLHNGKDIFFCKTDFLLTDFDYISKLNNKVILISGNSDYPITDELVNSAPKNIIKWFAQNVLSNNNILEPIPIGIENKIESDRKGHGVCYYDRVYIKEKLLSRNIDQTPTKYIYCNFNINTNVTHRSNIKAFCNNINYIDVDNCNLSLYDFFNKILDYKMVLCPAGNGVDTHRLWETIYSKRVPITVRVGDFKIYELYKKLPIIILEDIKQLDNYSYINECYNIQIKKGFDNNILRSKYWIDAIKQLQ